LLGSTHRLDCCTTSTNNIDDDCCHNTDINYHHHYCNSCYYAQSQLSGGVGTMWSDDYMSQWTVLLSMGLLWIIGRLLRYMLSKWTMHI